MLCHFGLVYETIFNTIIFKTVKKRFESRALACRWWWRGHKSQINFLGMKVGKAEAKIKMIMQAIKQFNLETTVHNECVGLNCMQIEVLFWTNHLDLLTRHVWLISGALTPQHQSKSSVWSGELIGLIFWRQHMLRRMWAALLLSFPRAPTITDM